MGKINKNLAIAFAGLKQDKPMEMLFSKNRCLAG